MINKWWTNNKHHKKQTHFGCSIVTEDIKYTKFVIILIKVLIILLEYFYIQLQSNLDTKSNSACINGLGKSNNT